MSNRRAATVKVHPLALLNISDHVTRMCYADQSVGAVRGFLIGYSDGADITITNSFQCVTDELVCAQHASTRIRQYAEVFPNASPVGWYSVGPGGPPSQEAHTFMEGIVGGEDGGESLVALVVRSDNESAWLSKESETLPIQAFERGVDGSFIELNVRICMDDEAENIAVGHVTKNAKQASTAGTYEHLVEPTIGAIAMLNKKIESLLEYVNAVQRQEVEVSRPLLRSISAICDRLTAMSLAGGDGTALRADWDEVVEDCMAVALAAEGTANVAEFCATMDRRRIAARAPKALQMDL
ncbi:COP9 signalosome complex subunit 6 [Perkinsus olseni]|uniref:COP9 signalosome complex subunit 6 n=1 Tax=Perkinsus olseni TaxID=32597 RepID=A0A7J6MJ79_PEROL|nr:COP9 signalosome complex subunit 6 [Perkinsus olseni]KAF4671658.1 COP9 signalosome complex subunit 6 [Perkinsus olseni]